MKRAHKLAAATLVAVVPVFFVGLWFTRPKWPSEIARARGRAVMAKAFPSMSTKDVDATLAWLWDQKLTIGFTHPQEAPVVVVFGKGNANWLADGVVAVGAHFYPVSGEGVV